MKTVFMILSSVILGAFLAYLFIQQSIAVRKRRRRLSGQKRKPEAASKNDDPGPQTETSKKIIWVCLVNGFAWVWCSYILAYLDRVQIAESLSQVAVTEIIGVVLAYCFKSAVENLSKYNNWPDKGGTGGKG